LREGLSFAIAMQRKYWKLTFGDAEAGVTTAEAYRLFILPKVI
jgi:hypothetical protein